MALRCAAATAVPQLALLQPSPQGAPSQSAVQQQQTSQQAQAQQQQPQLQHQQSIGQGRDADWSTQASDQLQQQQAVSPCALGPWSYSASADRTMLALWHPCVCMTGHRHARLVAALCVGKHYTSAVTPRSSQG
jgi:hypothetical protein